LQVADQEGGEMRPTQLLSTHEVAIRLGIAEDTVIRLAQDGTLPASKMDGTYWFLPEDVAAYADTHPDADPPGDGEVNDLIYPPDDPATPR
jgi:excisionase family DNA binding protein